MNLPRYHAIFRASHPLRLRQCVRRRHAIVGDELARLAPALLAVVILGWVAGQCASSLYH